jgi:hypothetical protein
MMESVYSIIKTRSGKITAKDIEKDLGSKYEAHYAILHLTKQGKIKRVKGFGLNRIEFYYEIILSKPDTKVFHRDYGIL